MSFSFKSLRSGSSGNCLFLWTDKCRILIDCGLGSQKAIIELLTEHLGNHFDLDAVLITHTHSDHINYSALRVFQENGINVRMHEECLGQLVDKHFNGYSFKELEIEPFGDAEFEIKDLVFEAIALRHEPTHPTYGFCIRQAGSNKQMIAATDFAAATDLLDRMIDSDFVFIESNHDLKMLRQNPNYASRFHMSNHKTAELLYNFRTKSKVAPKAVMLGHLSEQRNEESLAIGTIRDSFEMADLRVDFPLLAAPRYCASKTISID
jgi:phosphoribosyl 1,2-cyclic phosphodiesterase